MTFESANRYIASLEPRGWRLGLDRMQEFASRAGLLDSLGSPVPNYVHIAGTNGKGSVTAYVQSILRESGYATGAFFSPYVYDVRERIQVGQNLISPEDYARITEELIPVVESFDDTEFGGITEFEFKTAMGLMHWRAEKCEWVALEVGLGGRLDATNIVTPRVCVITSIGLDHTAILGDTLELIAAEKAGIIKENVPVVVGQMAPQPLQVIESVCADRNAPIWRFGEEITINPEGSVATPARTHHNLKPKMKGLTQGANMALAVAALDACQAWTSHLDTQLGVERAFVPGRFEERHVRGRTVILDGAHNPPAAEALAATLATEYANRRFVGICNMVTGHEVGDFFGPLASILDEVFVPPINFHRAYSTDVTSSMLAKLGIPSTQCATVSQAISRALDSKNDHILVCGSFYLIGEVGRALTSF